MANAEIMRNALQQDDVFEAWINSLTIVDARTHAPTDGMRVVGTFSKRIGPLLAAWLDLEVGPKPGGAIWISAGRFPSHAVVIPQDAVYTMPLRLDVVFERIENGAWQLSTMTARLADPAELASPTAPLWTTLWEAQRTDGSLRRPRIGEPYRQAAGA